jgi:hypothetical protein
MADNSTETSSSSGDCKDCPKKGSVSNYNSSDGNTYTYGLDGAWHLAGPTLIGLGADIIPKASPFAKALFPGSRVVGQASKTTSVASLTLRRALPLNTGVKILGTKTLGGILGRFVPIAGWALTAYDILTLPPVDSSSPLYNFSQNISNGNVCFVKGTLVSTENGLIPIENIKIKDEVHSYKIDNKEVESSKVLNILERETKELFEITVLNEKIYVTSEHCNLYTISIKKRPINGNALKLSAL